MTAQRFVGTAWASVHGPSDPARLLRWTLESRFKGIVPGPAPRNVDWAGLRAICREYPVAFPAVRASSVLSERPATADLAAPQAEARGAAMAAVDQAARLAGVMGTKLVIVDPGVVPLLGDVGVEDLGDPAAVWTHEVVQALLARRKAARNGALDRVCRALFELCKRHPDTVFCLSASRSLRAVATIEDLQAIFEDLGRERLAYWHDAALVARRQQVLGEPQGAWLDAFSNLCQGCNLGDASDQGVYLPPGSGGVDYPLLSSYLRRHGRGVPACLELDPAVAVAELPGMRSCLDKFGL